jgi:hypothetical protein
MQLALVVHETVARDWHRVVLISALVLLYISGCLIMCIMMAVCHMTYLPMSVDFVFVLTSLRGSVCPWPSKACAQHHKHSLHQLANLGKCLLGMKHH